MPRTRSIPWGQRLTIFLDYRRLGKVYPTAKKHGIARSTVAAIIQEFQDWGFSLRPRPHLSTAILTAAQERHLQDIVEELRNIPEVSLAGPSRNFRGGLDVTTALNEDATPEVALGNSLSLSEPLLWHLKGSEAEVAVQEGRQGILEYNRRCLELWLRVRSALEDECRLKVWPFSSNRKGPYIPHELVDLFYVTLFGPYPDASLAPGDWNPDPNDAAVLRSRAFAVAVGELEHHESVRRGVARLIGNRFLEFLQQATELGLLHHDLKYVVGVVEEALRKAPQETVQLGICPECPYPEARIVASEGSGAGEYGEGEGSE